MNPCPTGGKRPGLKFDRNVANDAKHYSELEAMGWNVIVIWQCELKKSCFETTMQRVMNELTENYINMQKQNSNDKFIQ